MFDIETIVSISIVVATIDALNTAGGREQLEKGAVRSLMYTFELFWLPHRTFLGTTTHSHENIFPFYWYPYGSPGPV